MNFRGGCCIARYGGGGGGCGGYDMSKVDRIMLRYRPIAPRPDSGGSSSPPEKNESASANVSSKSRRGKRKYSKEKSSSSGSINSNGNSKRCNRRRNETGSGVGGEMVTLPLLPETPEKKNEGRILAPMTAPVLDPAAVWLSFGDGARRYQTDLRTELITENVVSSLLTVECVTERCEEVGYELGCKDDEIKMNLERDTCPAFISDGLGRVIWTNASFKKLVFGKEEECSKMNVWLVMKEKPPLMQRTFTCRMRLQYTCRDKEMSSITSFCDVWKMNDGGFAWRLDVNAALCLGRWNSDAGSNILT